MTKVRVVVTLLVFTFVILAPGWARPISFSDEEVLGKKLIKLIRKSAPLIEDGEILTYVNEVGQRLVDQVGVTPYKFRFFVLDEPVPNAFAAPGGNIFIYRGLLEMMSSEDELASILGHECGHIMARHLQRSIDEAKISSIGMLAGLIAGIFLGAPGLAAGGMAASQSAALKYSREHEMEADLRGLGYMSKAGYNPEAMPAMMRVLLHHTWLQNSNVPDYLQTHPATQERVLYLDELVKKERASGKFVRKPSVGNFKVIQTALIAGYSDEEKALERFRAGIKKGDSTAVYGLGRLFLREQKWGQAVVELKKAARLMPCDSFVLSTLAEALRKTGKLEDARRILESALSIDPSSAIAHYRLALVLMDLGKKDEAIENLTQIEELAPTFPDIDYQLGVAFGQTDKLGLAHFYLGCYYYHEDNSAAAIEQLKMAKPLITNSPSKLRKTDDYLNELVPKKKHWFSSRL
ncbi:MAG: M48 family metalloprotease [Syntrophobacteraceae bacterium]|nr:M48 family metalloprotease [Syntrophobacteraceae bacterium]